MSATTTGRRPGAKGQVLFVSSAEHPGADTFIHMLIMRTLDRARFDVHVACPSDTNSPGYRALAAISGVHLHPANFGPSLNGLTMAGKLAHSVRLASTAAGFVTLARQIRRQGISVIHSTDRPRDAVACAVLGKMSGAKAIIHAHLKCGDWLGGSIRWSMRQVDALIGVSEFVTRSLVEYGYDAAKTHAVLNAIDLPRWDFRLDGGPIRQSFGIPSSAPVISCAARLFRAKGQDVVVKAVAAIRSEFPDVRLLIIGSDDRMAMRESFTAELTQLASNLGISENVIFTGQRSDMPLIIAASDVFALASDEEPFGLVFAESMAMKKPVAAVANGGTPEVVEHGKSGLLSPAGDAEALANNLRILLRDPELRGRMGEHGRRVVEEKFTAGRLAADTAKVYASLTPHANTERVALATP
jgi:glycosyltransferase involved in cell wall biosynthesis